MLYRKPSASTSIQMNSPKRFTARCVIVRTLVRRFGHSVSKQRKSCRPTQAPRRPAHRLGVERLPHEPGVLPQERVLDAAVLDDVAVHLAHRVLVRVRSSAAPRRSSRTHTSSGSLALIAFSSASHGQLRRGVDIRDLADGVDAGVGAAAGS